MIALDHVGIGARDTRASAQWLANILGAPAPLADGPDGDMFRIDVAHGTFVLFNPAEKIDPAHVAFRVARREFDAIVERLAHAAIPFGNRHDDPTNGATEDFVPGAGRVYFVDPNGHLFEVTTAA